MPNASTSSYLGSSSVAEARKRFCAWSFRAKTSTLRRRPFCAAPWHTSAAYAEEMGPSSSGCFPASLFRATLSRTIAANLSRERENLDFSKHGEHLVPLSCADVRGTAGKDYEDGPWNLYRANKVRHARSGISTLCVRLMGRCSVLEPQRRAMGQRTNW